MALSFTKEEFPTSDFVLVTSDKQHVHVHRSILEAASPFFQDMFMLPQPHSTSTSSVFPTDSTNEIQIPESSSQITTLLTLIYPTPTSLSTLLPRSMSLQSLSHLLSISQKYLLTLATQKLTSALLDRAKENPRGEALKVYAIGCWCDVPELVRGASQECMRVGFAELFGGVESSENGMGDMGSDGGGVDNSEDEDTDVESNPEFEHGGTTKKGNDDSNFFSKEGSSEELLKRVSAWDYHRLLRLHIHRSSSIKSILQPNQSLGTPPPCAQCSSTTHFGLSLPPKWFIYFQSNAPLLIDQYGPHSGTIFGEEFLGECVKNGCARCGSGLMSKEGRGFLKNMRERVDTLVGMVDA